MLRKIFVHLNAYLNGIFKIFFKEKNSLEIIVKEPKKVEPPNSEKAFYERLFNFYRNMKFKEINNPEITKPSSLWQNHINNDYKFLIDSFKKNDLANFSFFLNNFGNWNNYLGIEHNTLLKRYSKNLFLKSYLKNEIFLKHYKIWKDFGYEKKDLNKISTPEFGNQLGAYIDGNFVTIGSFFNQIISKILYEHIKHKSKPIICDLGGGYGKLGYFLIKNFKDSCFIDFDIPEVLVLAAYYLMSSFPNKKTLLFGEKEFKKKDIENFDLIFMPSVEITNYCSKIFFHMNHNRIRNVFDDKDKSLISSEYPIDMKKFDLVFDYPDLSHFIYTGRYDSNNDIFMKLFKIKQKLA